VELSQLFTASDIHVQGFGEVLFFSPVFGVLSLVVNTVEKPLKNAGLCFGVSLWRV
jgi:hypothetical protein